MFEVLEGSQVDIRCGMPLMREPFGDRHFSVKEDLEPVADVAEIDYADYSISWSSRCGYTISCNVHDRIT